MSKHGQIPVYQMIKILQVGRMKVKRSIHAVLAVNLANFCGWVINTYQLKSLNISSCCIPLHCIHSICLPYPILLLELACPSFGHKVCDIIDTYIRVKDQVQCYVHHTYVHAAYTHASRSRIHCANKGLFGPLKHASNQAFNRTIFLHWKFGSTKWAF